MADNTERFSDRVDDYKKHRPDYPRAVIDHLETTGFLTAGDVVADLGAGTGIFSRRLLDAGYDVIAVEPNEAMASAIEPHDRLRVIGAPAEATTLDDASVDLVTAAQALHWFDPAATRAEVRRIAKHPHPLAAVWNRRDTTSTPFLVEYEALLREEGIGYVGLMASRDEIEASLTPYFGNSNIDLFSTPQVQTHDWDGLVGRLLSSSYGPRSDHPAHERVMKRLRAIFDAHAVDGAIEIIYDCRVYTGHVT